MSALHRPQVSVLMSVYNAEPYLPASINSILNQTLTDFEYLIMDDGSTDKSLEILTRYAAQDSRIQVIARENQGISRARNQLLQLAQAKVVAIMDADDIAMPTRLADQMQFLKDHPEVICVGGAYDVIDEQDRYLTTLIMPEDNKTIQQLALVGHTPINHPCATLYKQPVLEVGGYDEALRICHDLDLWLKLGELGQLANLRSKVLRYRIHDRSTSEVYQALAIEEKKEACRRAWERRGIQGLFEAELPWRPGPTALSRHTHTLKYGWWAFNNQQRQTALHYGLKAVRLLPLKLSGWKLVISALFKPMPQPSGAYPQDHQVEIIDILHPPERRGFPGAPLKVLIEYIRNQEKPS